MVKRLNTATVYKITNEKTGHCYIGATIHSVAARWGGHIRSLRKGTHTKALQAAWSRSKITDWTFRVLETDIPTPDKLRRESAWMARLCPLYNCAKNVDIEAIAAALGLRKAGWTLRAIAKELHMSLGWASKVVNNYKLSSERTR